LGLLTACAILISCVDLQSRPAQAASSIGFRIISALAVRPYFKSVPWGREAGDWVPWLLRYRAGADDLSPNSSAPSSLAGSDGSSTWSGKDVSSFRIPDRKLKARPSKHTTRHHPNGHHHQHQRQLRNQSLWARAPRVSGVDYALTPPVTSPTAGSGATPFTRSKSMPVAGDLSIPTSPSPLSPRSPLHFTLGVGRTRHPHFTSTTFQQQKSGVTCAGEARSNNKFHSMSFSTGSGEDSASGLSTGTVFNPNARRSSIVGGDLLSSRRYTPSNTAIAAAAAARENNNKGSSTCTFSHQSSEGGCRTPDMTTAETWSSQATASLSSLTSRVDALLRPLVPPSGSNMLMRWPSAPTTWPFCLMNNDNNNTTDDHSGDDDVTSGDDYSLTHMSRRNRNLHLVIPPAHKSPAGRRVGLHANHGSYNRHYTYGGIAAHPSRRTTLERYAYAARMAAGSEKAAASSAVPGRIHGAEKTLNPKLSALDIISAESRGHGSESISALASVGLDGDCPESIRQLITDEHLLQLGALMGESACEAVIKDLNLPFACTERDSLCGSPSYYHSRGSMTAHNTSPSLTGWEELTAVTKEIHGLRLRSWRLLMRKGLYAYKTVVEIDGIDPSDIRPFHLDDQAHALWDDGALEVLRPIPGGCSRASRHAESCLHSYLSKFPGPLAPRRYNYARRVWHRPSDGGCYSISQNCEIAPAAISGTNSTTNLSPHTSSLGLETRGKIREVPVLEFTSAVVIRAVEGGSEISTFYFEDSQVRAGLAKVAVPKGLWPFWTKYEAALRLFADARAVTHSVPHPSAGIGTGSDAAEAPAGSGCAAARRNVDAWNGGSFALNDDADGIDSDGEGSDDELYGALVQLKAARKRAADRRGGALGASTRWARGIAIAGALKMVQVMLATH